MADSIDIACPKCGKASKAPGRSGGEKNSLQTMSERFRGSTAAPGAKAAWPAKRHRANPPQNLRRRKRHCSQTGRRRGRVRNRQEPLRRYNGKPGGALSFCAMPLDPPDARDIVCTAATTCKNANALKAGRRTKMTAMDYFIYHLPTIACFIAIIIAITIDVISMIYAKALMEGTWFENEDHTFAVKPDIVPLYVTWRLRLLS